MPCIHNNKRYSIKFQVVDIDHGPLLFANCCTELGLIKYCNKVQVKYNENNDDKLNALRKKSELIIKKNDDIFEGYGLLAGEIELEIDMNIKPVIQPARRIPMALRTRLKVELEKLVTDGIIVKEEDNTDWVSNIFVVQKGESFRVCLDPIPLNTALKRPHYHKTIDEILITIWSCAFTRIISKLNESSCT